MAFEIIVHEAAVEELEALRMFDQRIIVDAIGEQLKHQPTVPTRRRKSLGALALAFENVPPLWELRVGHFRVFYDVDKASNCVHVRAVRRKEPRQRTEDIR
jgi:mRNA-degrading endonuclease RelE of RelBE toxin-antitoxin system